MSSIRATRLGFIYQDKFALLQYLSLLQAGKKVLEFFVDYPRASSQKSIDIRIIEEVAGKYVEHIYEVKTGQSFKLDKKYKGTSEIREAITNIKDYCKDKKDIYTTIVISPELKGKVSSYWDSIQAIEGSSAFQGSVINSCEQLVRLLQISDLNDAQGLYKFCKNVQIHICDSYSDIPNGDDTNASPMDNQIIAILREFNDIFKVDAFEYELPPSLLYHSLLHTLSYKVGTAENIAESLDKCITEFFTRRKLINHIQGLIFHDVKEGIVKVYQNWKTRLPSVTSSVNTNANYLEGGSVL